jgi:hypothetical protein
MAKAKLQKRKDYEVRRSGLGVERIEAIKIISFVVAVKRFKNNSVLITRKNKRNICSILDISLPTFNKYLERTIEIGWARQGAGRVIMEPFVKIAKEFQYLPLSDDFEREKRHNYCLTNRGLISGKCTDYKTVFNEVCDVLLVDNVFRQQVMAARARNKVYEWDQKNQRTERKLRRMMEELKKDQENEKLEASYKMLSVSSYSKSSKKSYLHDMCLKDYSNIPCVGYRVENEEAFVVTSARHLAKRLNVSVYRANRILNESKLLRRDIIRSYFEGCDYFTVGKLKERFPMANITPIPFLGKTRVSFGSILHVREKSIELHFNKKLTKLIGSKAVNKGYKFEKMGFEPTRVNPFVRRENLMYSVLV